MSAYIAVVIDSFRAAFSSRVLWIAFVAIWILLAALAPIGFRLQYTTDFRSQDFYNGTRLKAMLARGTVDERLAEKPIGRLAASMPDELSRQLRLVGDGDEVRIFLRVFADALNRCLDDESWYSEEAWSDTLQFRELRELDAITGPMDEELKRRRARLRIEAALPGVFETRASRSIRLTYAGIDFPATFAMDKAQFLILVNQYVLPVIIQWLMGFVLVFLGILVTSSMIPEMLQPGSLHLLLSKPISRTMLLLSKFLGGCTFVLLCVTQLVIGLFLIAWLRLDIWNARMLWCIPVSVFLFSVFYSVSTLAGLIWRSSILAIGVTCIFGSLCLVIGVIGGLFDSFVTRPASIRHIALAGDVVIGTTKGGGLVRWDQTNKVWADIFESNPMGADRVIPPVVVRESTVVTARVRGGRFNPFGSGPSDLLVMNAESGWVGEPSMRLPTSTTEIFVAGDQLIALNAAELSATSVQQIFRQVGESFLSEQTIDGESSESDEVDLPLPVDQELGQFDSQPKVGATGWLQKLSNMMGEAAEGFSQILPKNISLTPPRAVYMDSNGDYLIVQSRGRLLRFEKPETGNGVWGKVTERSIEGEAANRCWIAVSGSTMLLAREESPLQMFDVNTLEPLGEIDLPDSLSPVRLIGVSDASVEARYFLVTSDGLLRQVASSFDGSDLRISDPTGPREIESVYFDSIRQKVYISHHTDQIDIYDSQQWKMVERLDPSISGWRFVDRYMIGPLRFMTPQTGELGEAIEAIISGKTARTILDGPDAGESVRYELIRPIVSCSAFVFLMLLTSCYYFATRDF